MLVLKEKTTYGFDIAADVNSDSFTATGSSISKSFEGVEYTMTVLRALYMSNAMLRPHLARVIIRTSAAVDTLKGMTEHWPIILGPQIVLVVLLARRGLYGLALDWDARHAQATERS